MKQKVMLLAEANGNTALFSGVSHKKAKIGTGAAVYEMLTTIFGDLRARKQDIDYEGVGLGFFKDRFKLYDCSNLEQNRARGTRSDILFTRLLVNDFAEKKQDIFSKDWEGTLCTVHAVEAALKELSKTKTSSKNKTGFVFVSDTPTVFREIGEYIPARSQLPDLSVFCLNSEAVTEGRRFLSSFKMDSCEVKLFDYASVQNNMAQVISAFLSKYPEAEYHTEDLVRYCLEKRCGVAYALYDAIKTVFEYNHSYSDNLMNKGEGVC